MIKEQMWQEWLCWFVILIMFIVHLFDKPQAKQIQPGDYRIEAVGKWLPAPEIFGPARRQRGVDGRRLIDRWSSHP
jgi:hypothetical protein